MPSPRKNYYKILQVDPEAESEVVIAAYKRLALKYHPDTNKSPDATAQMQAINEAYAVLGDKAKRADYDFVRTREGGAAHKASATQQESAAAAQARKTREAAEATRKAREEQAPQEAERQRQAESARKAREEQAQREAERQRQAEVARKAREEQAQREAERQRQAEAVHKAREEQARKGAESQRLANAARMAQIRKGLIYAVAGISVLLLLYVLATNQTTLSFLKSTFAIPTQVALSKTVVPAKGKVSQTPAATQIAKATKVCPSVDVCIIAPNSGTIVNRGAVVDFVGTASKANFVRYKFEARQKDGETWGYIADFSKPVVSGVLMQFDTSSIPSGDYIFRLLVIDNTGNSYPEMPEIELIIQ